MELVVDTGDVKASIAVLSFVLSNTTKFSVNAESLSSELQQLGFPKGLFLVNNNLDSQKVCFLENNNWGSKMILFW